MRIIDAGKPTPSTSRKASSKSSSSVLIYEHIPVVVNSSMTTDAVKGKMTRIGIDGFVGKTDINSLYNITNKLLLR